MHLYNRAVIAVFYVSVNLGFLGKVLKEEKENIKRPHSSGFFCDGGCHSASGCPGYASSNRPSSVFRFRKSIILCEQCSECVNTSPG